MENLVTVTAKLTWDQTLRVSYPDDDFVIVIESPLVIPMFLNCCQDWKKGELSRWRSTLLTIEKDDWIRWRDALIESKKPKRWVDSARDWVAEVFYRVMQTRRQVKLDWLILGQFLE
ncbi:hypothetical protein [cf. Phormidesmis sp. LEGE 11477]|uniref:hypothetical protein n=1 Tax=cf. Phormidesmis sp. LEGE 11477 TaxID=1828680 RepID=UPI001880C016|nr:hypothetical protein [cf. Phormidesmis sp. LEGE 11477]MBE9064408.1 hypothetical protein [cf. Phormidesmis sp. LEGE 11477]